ncbi:hypothetical protein A2886_02730 [candidate division WWE3 bacterium RIFCSPHIGHO2_01_FULL_42_13]|uniref:Uncharacterized protein n=1 Tax=candidate division WWE3 bacterium RIFCSPHIGHO2_01_FULL_42_13 TaxID=1802617 RepID=A0A1F4URT9_UNCKA|nr:MAG: hypothetical protein A2886_02730 [candidate division WWE3 bacterium RIFCSPHIGHO2_01_FULL_42_13]
MPKGHSVDAVSSYVDFRVGDLEKRLVEKISTLPDKEKFFSDMDRWWTELHKIDMEQVAMSAQVRRNTKDIEELKKKL